MPRSSNRVASRRRRKKILKEAKGQRGGRRNLLTAATDGVLKGRQYAYRDRRVRKREFRRLWITRIGAAAKATGTSYGQLMGRLAVAGVEIDRKALSEMAIHDYAAFQQLVQSTQPGA